MKSISILIVGLIVLIFLACRHQPNIPNAPSLSFSADVQPIIGSNCDQSGCHGTIGASSFSLIDYSSVMEHVKAGDARNSKLYTCLTGLKDKIMPSPPNSPLTDAQINVIYIWIMQGAKNN